MHYHRTINCRITELFNWRENIQDDPVSSVVVNIDVMLG